MNIVIEWTKEQQEQIYNKILEMHKKAYEEITNNNAPYQKKFLNKKELMKFLHIGHDVMAKMRLLGLTTHKVGRQELYNIEEVYQTLEKM